MNTDQTNTVNEDLQDIQRMVDVVKQRWFPCPECWFPLRRNQVFLTQEYFNVIIKSFKRHCM